MELPIAGKAGSKITVSEGSFDCPYNEGLVHQVVTAYLATGRAGTVAQKTRAERRGGGAKPWRQKGTGRARAGSIRGPIWRGGGVTFAAKNRDYSQKVNRKMHRRAMAVIFSELVRQGRLIVVEDLTLSAPKTRELVEKLKSLESNCALCVTENEDHNLSLAARNLPGVDTSHTGALDPVELVRYEKIIITVDALKKIEEKLS